MSLLSMNLGDAQEPKAVPADEEYKIRILTIRSDNDKNDNPYLLPMFEIPDQPTSKGFTKFLRVPHQGMDTKQMNSAKWTMKLFLQAFGMDPSRDLDPEELVGKEGWAILGVSDDEEWGEQNYVKKFIAPK